MKKSLVLMPALIMGLFVFAGCGSSDNAEEGTADKRTGT